jgi:mRNA degradation ribonuclease J1/J2
MSNLARNILETVFCFSKSRGNITHETIDMQDQVPITIKDITVTPYIVDHSAYGAFMFLIQADEKKILYTRRF